MVLNLKFLLISSALDQPLALKLFLQYFPILIKTEEIFWMKPCFYTVQTYLGVV